MGLLSSLLNKQYELEEQISLYNRIADLEDELRESKDLLEEYEESDEDIDTFVVWDLENTIDKQEDELEDLENRYHGDGSELEELEFIQQQIKIMKGMYPLPFNQEDFTNEQNN